MELKEQYPKQNINVCVFSPSYIRTELSQQALNRMNTKEKLIEDNTSSAYEPDYVAKRIIKAIEYREQDVIMAPFQQYLAIWLRRFWPEGFFKMMIARNKRLKANK
jgi:short-subunit dehydrogenase